MKQRDGVRGDKSHARMALMRRRVFVGIKQVVGNQANLHIDVIIG